MVGDMSNFFVFEDKGTVHEYDDVSLAFSLVYELPGAMVHTLMAATQTPSLPTLPNTLLQTP